MALGCLRNPGPGKTCPMRLLLAQVSPYSRKVRVLIREAGRLAEVDEVAVATTPLAPSPDVMAANPAGRIPVLIRADGPALHDSRVITRYLDARFGSGLYPDGRLWAVLTIESTAEGMIDSALQMTYETRLRPPEQQSPALMDAHWGKIARSLDGLGDTWLSHLAGPPDMGQIALGCALGYLDLLHDARGWRQGRTALTDWYARFAQRPSMLDTAP